MYRVGILEEDRMRAEALHDQILRSPGSEAFEIATYETPAQLSEASAYPVDILLLGIRVAPDDPETAEGVASVRASFAMSQATQLIYLTSCESYRVGVYQENHAYFVMTPVRQADLDAALAMATRRLRAHAERPLRMRVKYTERVIWPREVTYVESKRRVLHIHTADEEIATYARLADLAEELPERFVRCHNSFVVNLDCVRELRTECVVLTDGTTIPVSRDRRPALRATFNARVRPHRG